MAMMNGGTAWSGQDGQMMQGTEDDFQQFLDMNGIGSLSDQLQFDFADFSAQPPTAVLDSAQRSRMDTPMTGTDISAVHAPNNPSVPTTMAPITSAPDHRPAPAPMFSSSSDVNILEIDAKIQYLQTQRSQFEQRRLEEQQAAFFAHQSRMVPPTPQSAELHGSAGQMFSSDQGQSQQQSIYDRFQRLKEQQDLSFTPLVSPAVTPLETHFPDHQYTIPGAYNFSPLSSPAIQSQNEVIASYGQRLAGITVNSPTDMQVDSTTLPAPPNELAKKARKASAPAAKSRSKASVRQSPITKPQKKRTPSTPNIAKHVISEIKQAAASGSNLSQLPLPAPAQPIISTDVSEDGSISPETITDMPPPSPPQPRSARQSPYIQPQKNQAMAVAAKLSPATPASLMKLPSPGFPRTAPVSNGSEVVVSENIDNLELPESVASPKPRPSVATQSPAEATSSLGQLASRSTNPPPLPSPSLAKPSGVTSASQSPVMLPGPSFTGAKKTPTIAPRGSKKRVSASVQVSPALRPRISPSIKPLLPGGGGSSVEDAALRTLAQKSNYQNILEGNNVPGVSYPTELSTNLTSKRTSHKIAEQGRRNRINSALQEIATLLPTEDGEAENGEGGGKKENKASSNPNSKASTVEMAIQYIKQLQQQVELEKERANGAEKRAKEAEEKLQKVGTEDT